MDCNENLRSNNENYIIMGRKLFNTQRKLDSIPIRIGHFVQVLT